MVKTIKECIQKAIKDCYNLDFENVHIEHPDNMDFGDYSSNIALVLTKIVKQPPMEIANKLVYRLREYNKSLFYDNKKPQIIQNIEILQPGFINFKFTDAWLKNVLFSVRKSANNYGSSDFYMHKKVIIEYTDPNPFKVFHIGHLMTNAIGESLSRIYSFIGADIRRANYEGDVGQHVAKSIWGLIKKLNDDSLVLDDLLELALSERIIYLGEAYIIGNRAYEEDATAQGQMNFLNFLIYKVSQEMLVEQGKWSPIIDYSTVIKDYINTSTEGTVNISYDEVKKIYLTGRQWSLEYFETLYKRLGTKFDFYFFESLVGELGYKIVNEHIVDGVFEENEGAVIFKGDKFGLHTRVFISSMGLPVYEAKDLGLAIIKHDTFPYDTSIIVTGNEVNEYFRVVLKALELIDPDLAAKTTHIGHGMLRFKDGKMSSRTGNVISGDELLNRLKTAVLDKMASSEIVKDVVNKEETADKIAISAIKYAILKNSIGNNLVYDEEEVLNLNGNSGPYLLYTYARIRSILEKIGSTQQGQYEINDVSINDREKDLLRYIYKFPEIVLTSAERLSPNLIAGYTFELAQKFNAFYADIPILNAENDLYRNFRIDLTICTGQVIKNGLNLLGIDVVDKM